MTFFHDTPVGRLFDYTAYIDEGFEAQQKYAKAAGQVGPMDDLTPEQRYAKIIEHMGHLMEEMVEARVYVPRRSWKNNEPSFLDNPELRKEFIAEMFDVTLFHRAILAYAGVSGEEFTKVAAEKMKYNSTRKDHNVNGTESAIADPAAELQGDCPSANYQVASQSDVDEFWEPAPEYIEMYSTGGTN